MAVSASDEPAAAEQAPKPWLTIGQRLAAIRKESFGIGKDDIQMQNAEGTKSFKIKGHTIEAVLSEMRPLLDKYGVDLTPNLVERSYNGNRCDVIVDFRFDVLDSDPGDIYGTPQWCERTVRWAGAGTDKGDKGFAKAGTNALKEMLKKVFLITDRDDAKEETEAVEHQTEEGASRQDVARVTEQRKRAIEQWAKAFKMAVEKSTDLKDLQRLKRENMDQLSSEDLPEVTRAFFFELLTKREAELKE